MEFVAETVRKGRPAREAFATGGCRFSWPILGTVIVAGTATLAGAYAWGGRASRDRGTIEIGSTIAKTVGAEQEHGEAEGGK